MGNLHLHILYWKYLISLTKRLEVFMLNSSYKANYNIVI